MFLIALNKWNLMGMNQGKLKIRSHIGNERARTVTDWGAISYKGAHNPLNIEDSMDSICYYNVLQKLLLS